MCESNNKKSRDMIFMIFMIFINFHDFHDFHDFRRILFEICDALSQFIMKVFVKTSNWQNIF